MRSASKRSLGIDWLSRAGRSCGAAHATRHRVGDATAPWPGIALGALLVVGSIEFVGAFEENVWKLAGAIVPIAYTTWSLWLIIYGVVPLAA